MTETTLKDELQQLAQRAAKKEVSSRFPRRHFSESQYSEPQFTLQSKPESNSVANAILFVAVLVGVAVLVAAWVYKSGTKQIAYEPQYQEPYQEPYQPYDPGPPPQDRFITELTERTKWNTDKITLLGMLHNQNLAVQQQGHPRSDFIYINPDWTIDKTPNHLNLNENDKEFLEKYLKR